MVAALSNGHDGAKKPARARQPPVPPVKQREKPGPKPGRKAKMKQMEVKPEPRKENNVRFKRIKLYDEVMRLLHNTEFTRHEISMGTGLPAAWIWQLKTGKYEDPSVNRMQLLYEFLANKPLLIG